jgi:hypothetical protein
MKVFWAALGVSGLGIWAVNREAIPVVERSHCILVPYQWESAIGKAAVQAMVRFS